MHELLADDLLSKMIFELKGDHKELFYYKVLRRYSSTKLGAVLGQTDRNKYPKEMDTADETDAEEAVRSSNGQGEGETAPNAAGNRIPGAI